MNGAMIHEKENSKPGVFQVGILPSWENVVIDLKLRASINKPLTDDEFNPFVKTMAGLWSVHTYKGAIGYQSNHFKNPLYILNNHPSNVTVTVFINSALPYYMYVSAATFRTYPADVC